METIPQIASDAAPLEIGMLLYPGMTLLDLVGTPDHAQHTRPHPYDLEDARSSYEGQRYR